MLSIVARAGIKDADASDRQIHSRKGCLPIHE